MVAAVQGQRSQALIGPITPKVKMLGIESGNHVGNHVIGTYLFSDVSSTRSLLSILLEVTASFPGLSIKILTWNYTLLTIKVMLCALHFKVTVGEVEFQ